MVFNVNDDGEFRRGGNIERDDDRLVGMSARSKLERGLGALNEMSIASLESALDELV